MRRAAFALAAVACASLTWAPAPVAAGRAIDPSATGEVARRDDGSPATGPRRVSGAATRPGGRHADPRAGTPAPLAVPVDRTMPAAPALSPGLAIAWPPARSGRASSGPGLARAPPRRR